MIPPSHTEGTIYSGQYSYRKPAVLLAGVLLLVVAGGFLIAALRAAGPAVAHHRYDRIFFFALAAAPGAVGIVLLRNYLQSTALQFAIGPEGVLFGAKLNPWAQVRGFIVRYANGHLSFCVCRRRLHADLNLTLDAATTSAEAEQAVARLERFLETEHPEIWLECYGL